MIIISTDNTKCINLALTKGKNADNNRSKNRIQYENVLIFSVKQTVDIRSTEWRVDRKKNDN